MKITDTSTKRALNKLYMMSDMLQLEPDVQYTLKWWNELLFGKERLTLWYPRKNTKMNNVRNIPQARTSRRRFMVKKWYKELLSLYGLLFNGISRRMISAISKMCALTLSFYTDANRAISKDGDNVEPLFLLVLFEKVVLRFIRCRI